MTHGLKKEQQCVKFSESVKTSFRCSQGESESTVPFARGKNQLCLLCPLTTPWLDYTKYEHFQIYVWSRWKCCVFCQIYARLQLPWMLCWFGIVSTLSGRFIHMFSSRRQKDDAVNSLPWRNYFMSRSQAVLVRSGGRKKRVGGGKVFVVWSVRQFTVQ